MADVNSYNIEVLVNADTTTKRQKEMLLVFQKEGTLKGVANVLNVREHTIGEALRRCNKNYLAAQVDELVADRQILKGTTTLYKVDEDTGKKREVLQWVKTKVDDNLVEAIEEYTNKLASRVEGLKPKVVIPTETVDDLLTVYVTTDMHLGQYSWKEETGKDVNVNTVYNNTLKAHQLLQQTTPKSKKAIVLDLGDTMHSSDDANRTKSGHELDVDTRHAKIFQKLVDLKINIIDSALEKHESVKYIVVPGNHSDLIGHYLVAMLSAYYRNESRFEVDKSAAMHKYYRHGKAVLLGFHHGHSTKLAKLPEIMVWDRKEDISDTTYRYWLTGHVHQQKLIDNPICQIESFRNLTPNDAWAAGAGFRGLKQATAITYSSNYGEVARNIVSIQEVEESKHG